MKAKVKKFEKNSVNKSILEMYKGINQFKKGYQPRAYVLIIKKDDGKIVVDSTSILSRWEQFYSNLLNVNQSTSHEGSEICTAKTDIPELVCQALKMMHRASKSFC